MGQVMTVEISDKARVSRAEDSIRPGTKTFMAHFFPFVQTGVLTAILWVSIGLLGCGFVHASPNIPDTGQTKCYDTFGNELNPCPGPGEPFYGQDAQHQPRHPRSYTKLGVGGVQLPDDALLIDQGGPWLMTRDNVTGLTWEVKTAANKNDTYNWKNSKDIFIAGLNAASYGGFSDWRMPTIKELKSLVYAGGPYPAVDANWFPNMATSPAYCSSTILASNTSRAWGMQAGGSSHYCDISDIFSWSIRAVRGAQVDLFHDSIISGRMVDNGDKTVTDTSTGLMWQHETAPDRYNWPQALTYAEDDETAGYADWRLPNFIELSTLVDFTKYYPAIDSLVFPDTVPNAYYWTSTSAINSIYTFCVHFHYGYLGISRKEQTSNYVRAVRGGQFGSFENLMISNPVQGGKYGINNPLPIAWNPSGFGANVKIQLSRDGGITFETLAGSTPNDGVHEWTVAGAATVNGVLRIEGAADPGAWQQLGFFSLGELGDVNGDGVVDLADAIAALQITVGTYSGTIHTSADVNGDDKIGMEEVIYILETVAGVR